MITKEQAIDILKVLSRADGFLIASTLPGRDVIFEDLGRVSEILSKAIKESEQ